ncbi:Peptidase family M48 [Monaibacterium marinum]|uniref:Peptidase family M48 n=1 Tax=Pontivivens marinum TaxID=1690039 RepID=A0A2C9CMJ1_9RHOB|nr:M48 family metallopeptidase [Monaibacterium marinum]SOH92463.1 Peptidase family M48 [Monaibacterium marinum]
MGSPARYFDGYSGKPRQVTIAVGTSTLAISALDDGRQIENWAFSDLRALPGGVKDGVFTLARKQGDARVECDDSVLLRDLRRQVRGLTRGPMRRRGTGRIALWAGGAVGALGVMIFALIPRLAVGLTDLIEPSIEMQMGDQVRGRLADISPFLMQDRSRACVAPEGRKALSLMVARLTEDMDLPYALQVEVWDADIVNAITLPGGRVIFFNDLIAQADSAEEVAGVLAHEIGHVAHRDGLRLSLRAAGSAGLLGLIVGDASGGAAAIVAAEQLLNASYTRDAEAAADEFAFALLDGADVDVAALGGFFERIGAEIGEPSGVAQHFATHPDLALRADQARSFGNSGTIHPILTDVQWQDLRQICDQTAPL